MSNTVHLLIGLAIFFQASSGMAGSHRKIDYTLQIKNDCKNTIKDFDILYDGQNFLDNEGGYDIAYRSGTIFIMPMIIPDLALVTWKDFKGTAYEAKVPLSSLIRFKEFFGHRFRVEYHLCDDQLRIVFGKATRQFGYERKEIWTNQKGKNATDKS